jgi:carbon storage regulator
MLVLSRKERQRIKLGESIVVTVVRVSGDRVRLGIEAPADVIVLREELDEEGAPIAAKPRAVIPQASMPEGMVELQAVDAA